MVALAGKGWKLAPALVTLVKQIDLAYPKRDRTSDGSIGDLAHSARTSDHNPNSAGIVCALDIDRDIAQGFTAADLAEILRRNRDPRIAYIISRARMARSYAKGMVKPWDWSKYTGPNGHFEHTHISLMQHASMWNDASPWKIS